MRATAQPIPVAVAVDGTRPPAWQAKVLELIARSSRLHAVEVRRIPKPRPSWVWRAHAAIERRLFRIWPDALAATDVEEPRPGPAAQLVIWLAAGAPSPGPQPTIRLVHGPGREDALRAFPRAVLDGIDSIETEVWLQAASPLVIGRTVSGVRPFSATLSRNLALWKAADLVVRGAEEAADLVVGGAEEATAAATVAGFASPAESRAWPASFFARSLWRWGRALLVRLLFRRPWSILVRRRAADPVTGWARDVKPMRWAPGHVYADPFLFEHEGRHHLFCEEIPAGSSRGAISHVELAEAAPTGPPSPVLERPHHLSYPHVFTCDGEVFLIPETSQTRRVELYRAIRFPDRWELDAVLLDDLDIVDATLLEHDGRWWLFAGVAGYGASHLDDLHLFFADELRGPWTAHPRNPVVSDICAARPAGAIQRLDGQLVRPAQDGSQRYGWAVTMRAIDVLTTTDYRERETARLEPKAVPGARALHTYSRDSRYEAIDIRRRESRLRAWLVAAADRRGRRRR